MRWGTVNGKLDEGDDFRLSPGAVLGIYDETAEEPKEGLDRPL